MLTFGQTGCGAGRSYCIVYNLSVTVSIYVISNVAVSARASVSGVALFGAGGSSYYCRIGIIVTQCINFISNVAVATRAGVSGIALIGVSRSSYYCSVGVTDNGLSLFLGGAANGTGEESYARIGAGRIGGNYAVIPSVTGSRDFLECVVHVTVRAVTKLVTGLGTGRLIQSRNLFVMLGGIYFANCEGNQTNKSQLTIN